MLEMMAVGKKRVVERLVLVPEAIPLTDEQISSMSPQVYQMLRVGTKLWMMPHNTNQVNPPIYLYDATVGKFVEQSITGYPYSGRYRGRLFPIDGELGHIHNYVVSGSVYGFMMKGNNRIDTVAFKGIANQMGSGINRGAVMAAQIGEKLRFGYFSIVNSTPVVSQMECSVTTGISNANITLNSTATFNGITTSMGASQWLCNGFMYFLFDNGRFYRAQLTPTGAPVEYPTFPGTIKPLSTLGWNKPVLGTRLYFLDTVGDVYYFDTVKSTWNFVETLSELTAYTWNSYAEALNDKQIIFHPGIVKSTGRRSKDVYIYTPPAD